MRLVRLESRNDFAEWRAAARALLTSGTPPEIIVWEAPAPPPTFSPIRESIRR